MKNMNETMMAAIFDVFEKMFYVFLEPVNDENPKYDMEASIHFNGVSQGEVKVLVSEQLAKSMVQNLLGLEGGDIAEKDIEDCVKEAANMICGNFLGKLDQTKVFDLSTPTFSRSPGKALPGNNVYIFNFDTDGEGLGVILSMLN
ncbi:MAG: chemotaxis protein CheX [Syntrophaceae bacterium]